MAILTKEEFAEQFDYARQSIFRLIRSGKIVERKDGLIDTTKGVNVEFCEKRKEKLNKDALKKQRAEIKEEINKPKNQKSADQLALEIDLLNARLEEKQQKSELTKIQIAKARKEVIETDVLNRCIQAIFSDFIKNLTELPNIYATDLIKFVQTEEEPKEYIVEFLTQKISSTIKQSLNNAKEATKKYYNEGE